MPSKGATRRSKRGKDLPCHANHRKGGTSSGRDGGSLTTKTEIEEVGSLSRGGGGCTKETGESNECH